MRDPRVSRLGSPSLRSWVRPRRLPPGMRPNAWLECGWGRLIFGQTFSSHDTLLQLFAGETEGRRDVAIYVWEHHLLVGRAPDELFVDPSMQYRLWLHTYRPPKRRPPGFRIRPLISRDDALAQNRVYRACGMLTADLDVVMANHATRVFAYFLAVDADNDEVVGTVSGVDHVRAFGDPDNGASFWSLAVHPECRLRGVGKSLVRQMAEYYLARDREYLDLSVMYDNRQAIRLYRSLGFQRVPVYVVKRKNAINRPLYRGDSR